MKWRKRTIKIKKEILLKSPTSFQSQIRLKLIENSLKAIEPNPQKGFISLFTTRQNSKKAVKDLSMQFNFHQKRTVRGTKWKRKTSFLEDDLKFVFLQDSNDLVVLAVITYSNNIVVIVLLRCSNQLKANKIAILISPVKNTRIKIVYILTENSR